MKKTFVALFIFLILSCSGGSSDCEENSFAYWTTTMFGTPHNSKIQGENFTIRKAFSKIKASKTDIEPKNGFITLKIHIDKNGKFCSQEHYQISDEYKPVEFNNGKLISELQEISSNLNGWQNDTKTKTYYLIRFTIKNGRIEEIF